MIGDVDEAEHEVGGADQHVSEVDFIAYSVSDQVLFHQPFELIHHLDRLLRL